jgi:aspartate carbamoyltransferase catalytic subunit
MKNVISVEDFTKEQLERVFSLADQIKREPKKFANALSGKLVATLFYEPSTRTRCSFESAIQRLGAGVISTENACENASAQKGESLEDTIKIMAGYADAIVMRHFEGDAAARAARVSSVPILNAGSGSAEHPTQAVLDAFTLREMKGRLDNLSIVIMGDLRFGRTANSLIRLLSLYSGIRVYGFSPKGLELPETYVEFLRRNSIEYIKCESFTDIPRDVDMIYQTRIQKERLQDKNMSITEFCIDKKSLENLSPNTLIMHPLPRINEIACEVDDDPRSVYFVQAHNGVPTRMALLLLCLGAV